MRTRTLLGLLLLVGCAGLPGWASWRARDPGPPLPQIYAKVRPGMPKTQVDELFGDWLNAPAPPGRPTYAVLRGRTALAPDRTASYDGWEYAVLVDFDDQGRVKDKALAVVSWQPDGAFGRLRHLLRW